MKAISPFSVHDPRVQAAVARSRSKIMSPALREDPALLDFIDEIVELSHAEAPVGSEAAEGAEAAGADESLPLETLISWPFVAATPSASASSMRSSVSPNRQQQLQLQHET
jgi:hypothetical protein